MIQPTSYDLLNGELGGDVPNFFDDTYSGAGDNNSPLASLTGGLGDLTDGVIATQNWRDQHTAYVGWATIDSVVTFRFADEVVLDNIVFHLDDAEFGGVDNPGGIAVSNGTSSVFQSISDPAGTAPFSFQLATNGLTGNSFDVTFNRQQIGGDFRWVMVSEVQFFGESVPEPASTLTFAITSLMCSMYRWPRRVKKNSRWIEFSSRKQVE